VPIIHQPTPWLVPAGHPSSTYRTARVAPTPPTTTATAAKGRDAHVVHPCCGGFRGRRGRFGGANPISEVSTVLATPSAEPDCRRRKGHVDRRCLEESSKHHPVPAWDAEGWPEDNCATAAA
jgi:hypothetical protein